MADQQQPQGTQTQSAQGAGDTPNYVTKDELNELMNRAMTSRFADFQKKLVKEVETSLAPIATKLEEIGKQQSAPPQTSTTTEGKAIEEHPLVKGLQKQLGEAMKAVESLRDERDTEKRNARSTRLRQSVTEALTKGGVAAKHLENAVGWLLDSKKRVRFTDDESESLTFREDAGEVDFATGLKGWLKSDEAKIYLAATGTQGSGDRGGTKGPANGQQPMTAGRALLGMAMNAINGGAQQE